MRHTFQIGRQLCSFAVKLNVFNHSVAQTNSLCISHAESNFHETEMEIWAGFGQLTLRKKVWTDHQQLLRTVFSCFYVQIFFLKYCSIRTKKFSKNKWVLNRISNIFNCVLLYKRLTARLMYNDFAYLENSLLGKKSVC